MGDTSVGLHLFAAAAAGLLGLIHVLLVIRGGLGPGACCDRGPVGMVLVLPLPLAGALSCGNDLTGPPDSEGVGLCRDEAVGGRSSVADRGPERGALAAVDAGWVSDDDGCRVWTDPKAGAEGAIGGGDAGAGAGSRGREGPSDAGFGQGASRTRMLLLLLLSRSSRRSR